MNSDVIPELFQMSLSVGTGGGPAFLPASAGAVPRPNDSIFGLPIFYPEQCQTLGTVGDIYLADMSEYVTITKGGLQAASSIHVGFLSDQTVYRFVFRVDGQPLWSAALTPFKGGAGNSTSPFVALATRG